MHVDTASGTKGQRYDFGEPSRMHTIVALGALCQVATLGFIRPRDEKRVGDACGAHGVSVAEAAEEARANGFTIPMFRMRLNYLGSFVAEKKVMLFETQR